MFHPNTTKHWWSNHSLWKGQDAEASTEISHSLQNLKKSQRTQPLPSMAMVLRGFLGFWRVSSEILPRQLWKFHFFVYFKLLEGWIYEVSKEITRIFNITSKVLSLLYLTPGSWCQEHPSLQWVPVQVLELNSNTLDQKGKQAKGP